MTQRDLDEAVARLRAASSRNDPDAADLDADLGPPRGRPETVGQGPLDPDIVDAHAHVVTGRDTPPAAASSGGRAFPRSDWAQPLPRESVVGPPSAPRPAPPQQATISPEARARAEAQLRAAVEARGRTAPQGAPTPQAGPRPAHLQPGRPQPAHSQPARPAPAPAPAPQARPQPPRPVPEPPAPVLDDVDRRNRLGDPDDLSDGIVTDDHVEEPRRGGLLGRLRGLPARDPAAERAAPAPRRSRGRAEPQRGPLTPKEERWRRRKRRYLMEEILGWILVPIILVGLYFAAVWGLSLFGLTLDDVVAGAQQAWEALN
jgi:hypothetical protein